MRFLGNDSKGTMRYLLVLLFTFSLLSCGFNKDFIISAPTIGEKVRGPIRIIRGPGISIHLRPRNDLQTGEFNYVVMPLVPIGGNSDEIFAQKQTKERFVVGLSLFANQEDLALNFSDISLKLQGNIFKVVDIVRNPYANYPESQVRYVGDEDVLCPKSQTFDSELLKEEIGLANNGLWECYDLVFPVDAPSPRVSFQIEVVVKNRNTSTSITTDIPFEPYQWGHSDSFP